MTQNIPQSDAFTTNGGFGGFFCSYIRVVGVNSGRLSGYATNWTEGTLNQGYLVPYGGVAFTDTSAAPVADGIAATAWRAFVGLSQTVECVVKLATVSGLATDDSFRTAGVFVRAQGGSFDDTFLHEKWTAHSGYYLLLRNTAASGLTWQFVRVNAGVPTMLTSQTVPGGALAYIPAAGRKISLSITNVVGVPTITCKTANADGTGEVTLFGGVLSDTLGGNITTAGRVGWVATRDRQEAGATNTATVFTYLRAVDDSGPTEMLRDEFVRNPRHAWNSFTTFVTVTDGNLIQGRPTQSLWGSDYFAQRAAPATLRQPTDPANDRLKSMTSPNSNILFFLKGYQPNCGLCTDVSYVYTQTSMFGFFQDIYMFDFDPLGSPQRLQIRVQSGTGNIGYQFIEANQFYVDPIGGGSLVPWNIGSNNTLRWTVSITGTAPTRLQVFKLFVNGNQVPFHLGTGPLAVGWSCVAPGDIRWSETQGPLWVNRGGGVIIYAIPPNPDIDVDYLDTWTDTPTSCCSQTSTLSPVPLVLSVNAPTASVATPTSAVLPTVPLVLSINAPAAVIGPQGKYPRGALKTAGIVKGRLASGTAARGQV